MDQKSTIGRDQGTEAFLNRLLQRRGSQGQRDAAAAETETETERETREAKFLGTFWAHATADFGELIEVACIDTSHEDYWTGEPDAFGWARCLLDAMYGEEWTRDDLEQFCEQHFDKTYPAAHEVRAFIDGAKEVLAEV